MPAKFSDLPWVCVRSQYLIETSSFDLDGTVHVQKGACGLLWGTALKKTALGDLRGILNVIYQQSTGFPTTFFHHFQPPKAVI